MKERFHLKTTGSRTLSMHFSDDEISEILAALKIAENEYGRDAAREAAVAADHAAETHARAVQRCEQRAARVRKITRKILMAA